MNRNSNLDIYRIAAALLVLSIHVFQMSSRYDFSTGYGGVWMFFILSGYLAGYSLKRAGSARAFYKKRLLHILPTYYLALLLIYVQDLFSHLRSGGSLHDLLSLDHPCSVRFLTFFTGTNMWYPTDHFERWNNRSGVWTISVFLFFYLIAPLLFKLIRSFRVAFIVTAIALLTNIPFINLVLKTFSSPPFHFPESAFLSFFAEMNPVTELYCFLLGITLYYAVLESKQAIYLASILLLIVLTSFRFFHEELYYALALGIFVVLPPMVTTEKAAEKLQFFSRGTFTLYLFHLPFLSLFHRIPVKLGLTDGVLYIIVLYVSSLLFCYLLHYFVIAKIEAFVMRRSAK